MINMSKISLTFAWAGVLCLGVALAEEKDETKRLCDILSNDALIAFSITDVKKCKEDLLSSRLVKIIHDKEFASVTKDITDFYQDLIKSNMKDLGVSQVMESLSALNIDGSDLFNMLNGELTGGIFEMDFSPNGVELEFVLGVEVNSKVSALLKEPRALVEILCSIFFKKGAKLESEEIANGLTIYSLSIPELEAMNMTPSWAIVDTLLVFSNDIATLKRIIGGIKANTIPDGVFSQSQSYQAACKALEGEPAMFVRFNMQRLYPKLSSWLKPDNTGNSDDSKDIDVNEVILAMGMDHSGMIRETCICGMKDGLAPLTRPITTHDQITPPNGTLAWLQFSFDPDRCFDEDTLFNIFGDIAVEILKGIRSIEEELGFSVKKDVNPAFEGTLIGYAAIPYGENGHPAHYVPDIIFKAKIRDKAAVERLMQAVVNATDGGSTGFRPIEIDDYRGISLRGSKFRLDRREPTAIIYMDWLIISLLSPKGALRAIQSSRPGPNPLTVSTAGIGGLVTDTTYFIHIVDLTSILQFGYNYSEFTFFNDRAIPVVDFSRLPTENKLAQYLGPLAVVGSRKDNLIQMTMVSPSGFLPSLAYYLILDYWYFQRYDHLKSSPKGDDNTNALSIINEYPDWVITENGTYADSDGSIIIYAVGVASADRNPAKRWDAAKNNALLNITRILNTHVQYVLTIFAKEAGEYYDEATVASIQNNELIARSIAESFVSASIPINKYLTSDRKEAYVLMSLDLNNEFLQWLCDRLKVSMREHFTTKIGFQTEEAMKIMDMAVSDLRKKLSNAPPVSPGL